MFHAIDKFIVDFPTELDLTAPEVTEIQDLAKEATAVIDHYELSKAAASGLGEWRDNAFYGTEGDPLPVPPAPDPFVMPPNSITGIIAWLRGWREKWVVADGYTQAIGETLMVATPQGAGLDPSTVKPDLDCQTAMAGNFDFSVVIGNRGDSDACDLSACVVGTTNYQLLATFTGKAATGHWPNGQAAPVQIQVRAQLKRKNAIYGIPSDPFIVTVIP
jgi:hypothetical protein